MAHFEGQEPTSEELARMSREDRARWGARLDGVELVEYGERYVPGSPADRRAEAQVARWFLLAGLFAVLFVVAFIWWPDGYRTAYDSDSAKIKFALYTPILGVTLGGCILFFGLGVIALAKKIAPHEVAVQQRHIGLSAEIDRSTIAAEITDVGDKMGLVKRPRASSKARWLWPAALSGWPWWCRSWVGSSRTRGAKGGDSDLWVTLWKPSGDTKVRLTQIDGTPIRPEDIEAGSLTTVFPGVPRRCEGLRLGRDAVPAPAGRGCPDP